MQQQETAREGVLPAGSKSEPNGLLIMVCFSLASVGTGGEVLSAVAWVKTEVGLSGAGFFKLFCS